MRAPKKDVMLAGKYIIPARTTVFLPVCTLSVCPHALMHEDDGPGLDMDGLVYNRIGMFASRHQVGRTQMCMESVSTCLVKGSKGSA